MPSVIRRRLPHVPEAPIIDEVRDRALGWDRTTQLTADGGESNRFQVGARRNVEAFSEGVLENPLDTLGANRRHELGSSGGEIP